VYFRDARKGDTSHKDYWSGVATERDSMVAFGFRGRDGLFEDLVADVENTGAR
jgi:hypothetical protein